jgi:hypothetical protein
MTLSLKWVWELTPNQVFQKNLFIKPTTSKRPRFFELQERTPFTVPRVPLAGTDLVYQVALTSKGRTEDTKELRKAFPTFADSGDYRSGVLLFNSAGAIVGSLRMSGGQAQQPFKMVVNPDYRQKGLAENMLVLWWSNVKHTYRDTGKQPMTWQVVKVLLNAYKTVVEKAITDGLPVPPQVLADLGTQSEAAEVLRRAKAVDPNAK